MSAPNMFPIAGFFAVAQTVASHRKTPGLHIQVWQWSKEFPHKKYIIGGGTAIYLVVYGSRLGRLHDWKCKMGNFMELQHGTFRMGGNMQEKLWVIDSYRRLSLSPAKTGNPDTGGLMGHKYQIHGYSGIVTSINMQHKKASFMRSFLIPWSFDPKFIG